MARSGEFYRVAQRFDAQDFPGTADQDGALSSALVKAETTFTFEQEENIVSNGTSGYEYPFGIDPWAHVNTTLYNFALTAMALFAITLLVVSIVNPNRIRNTRQKRARMTGTGSTIPAPLRWSVNGGGGAAPDENPYK